jgi:hypothetical protein
MNVTSIGGPRSGLSERMGTSTDSISFHDQCRNVCLRKRARTKKIAMSTGSSDMLDQILSAKPGFSHGRVVRRDNDSSYFALRAFAV